MLQTIKLTLRRYLWFGFENNDSATQPDSAANSPPITNDALSNNDTFQKFSWLGHYGPCFPLCGEQVQVLTEPTQYYEQLKVMSKKAKKRITFASMYIGPGSLEEELVSCIHEACINANSDQKQYFEVNILLDMTRGSRGKVNSRTMLMGLLKQFPEKVTVSMYHTPDLQGVLKMILPERFNEAIGLTHLKVFIVDDSLIISGANLGHDYFTKEQDRYVMFNDCPDMADFFDELVKTVALFSFQLKTDDTLHLHSTWDIHPFQGQKASFKLAAKERVERLLKRHTELQKNVLRQLNSDKKKMPNMNINTWVYPLIQMGPVGIMNDERATLRLLRNASEHDEICLSSGYFNLTDQFMNVILQESPAKYRLLMAAPEVNGFYGAKGIAGFVPTAYVYIARQFFRQVQQLYQQQRIQLYEYFRENWIFHVKGLWYYLPRKSLPSLTLIGSSNFGYRSVYRDLECQVAVVTEDQELQEQLKEEHVRLYQSSLLVTPEWFQRADRHVPLWVTYVTGVIKNFF